MEAVLQPHERPSHIYWATRAEAALRQLVPFCFPVIEQTTVFSAFTGPHTSLFCVASREDLRVKTGIVLDADVVDLNVEALGFEVLSGRRAVGSSSFTRQQLANIKRFDLPANYCVLHPYSENARTPLRDLDGSEWLIVRAMLDKFELPGVVVNHGMELAPDGLGLIDLTNQTTLLEALQITALASAFIGCSSVLSVLAGHVVPKGRLMVKGHSLLRNQWAPFYYPYHSDCVWERLNAHPTDF